MTTAETTRPDADHRPDDERGRRRAAVIYNPVKVDLETLTAWWSAKRHGRLGRHPLDGDDRRR